MQPDDAFVEANGLRLHYLAWPPAPHGHPSVVLVHATGFLARLWQPVAERLASRYHVYAYDIRGHGDSDKPEPIADNYHWRHLADDLVGFLDAFALRDVPVVGHSSGGGTAAYVAATRPGYISRLVLIEPIIIPPHAAATLRPSNPMAEAARRRRGVFASPEEVVSVYRPRSAFARWTEEALRLYAEHGTFRREDGRVQLKCPGEIEALAFENSASLNVWEVLPQVACPALVVRGRHTDPFVGAMAQRVSEQLPNARLLTVEDAAHLVPMEQPEALAHEIAAFLDKRIP